MLDPQTADTAADLLPILRRCATGGFAAAVGGAHAKGTADHESDLDLYVFCDGVLPDDERSGAAMAGDPRVRDVVSWSVGDPFEQAGTDFYLSDAKVECWFRSRELVQRTIDECLAGVVTRRFVTWTTTGFYNHCCLSDLHAMIPIHDADGLLARWKGAIWEYPPALRESIIGQHLAAARFWPHNFHYSSAVERADVIYTSGIVQQVAHNLVQVLFAANRVYFPGDKKLASALSHLPVAPPNAAERIEWLLAPGEKASVDLLRRQQRQLRQLLRSVEEIVAASA